MRRRRILNVILAMVTIMLPMAPMVISVPAAHADSSADLQAMINNLRVGAGRPPLIADAALTAAAQQWSAHMASTRQLADAPLSTLVPAGWSKLGENVGVGGDVKAIFDALANQPAHKEIMIDPAFTLTGVGVATGSDGQLYASQFVETLRPAAASTTTAAKATTTTVASSATTTTLRAGATTTMAPGTTLALPVEPLSTTTTTAGSALAVGPAGTKGHGSRSWIFVAGAAAVALLGLVGAGMATRGRLGPK